MVFEAWAGIGELFIPPSSGPGIRLVDMPPPLLAINVALCALPVVALILILAGLSGVARFIPQAAPRLVFYVGHARITAVQVALSLVLFYVALFASFVGLAFLEFAGARVDPVLFLTGGLVFAAIPITIGWYLMFVSGLALHSLAMPWERVGLRAAVIEAGLFAALLIAAQTEATFAMGSAALAPNAVIPVRVPWADASAGVGGFLAVLAITLVARRASKRFVPSPVADAIPTV